MGKNKQFTSPLDILSDDHTSENIDPTQIHDGHLDWDDHDELVGEDRDGGPDHHVRHRPGKGGSDD